MRLVRISAIALALLLQACATPQHIEDSVERGELPSSDNRSALEIHTDLVRGMLAQKQYYAALAHIQDQKRQGVVGDQLRLLEAQARSNIGQTAEAETLYKSLLTGRYDGEAQQGLGLLYAGRNDFSAAADHLRAAVQRRPTNVEMRNDLGYALIKLGRYREALPELATAVELDPQGTRSCNNLVMLLVLMRDEAGVKRVATQAGISDDVLAGLRRQAQTLAVKPKPAVPVVKKS